MSAEDKKAMKRCLKRTTISRRELKKKLHRAEEVTVSPESSTPRQNLPRDTTGML
jgi:hypothetical protein